MTLFATYKKKMSAWYYIPTIFLLITLFMTLSRGAIYALAVGLLVLFIINIRKVKQNFLTLGLVALSFAISLAAQGSMVAFNPAVNETFTAGVAKSIHHLSLGTLDFRQEAKQVDANFVLTDETPTTKSDDIYFDGYVAESTQARLSFNELAFDAWKSSPTTLLFGAGLGSAGIAMNQTHPDQIGRLEITQNEYTEIPLELGLVGALLFVALLVAFFHRTADRKWTWVIIVAYLTQWIFFSGYPNAVHIYLVLFFLLVSPNLELKNYQNAKR
jgi:hypothetical protein